MRGRVSHGTLDLRLNWIRKCSVFLYGGVCSKDNYRTAVGR